MGKDKHDEKPKKVLATGASGDPEHPEAGAPGAALYEDFSPVTEVETKKKDDDK